MALGPSSLTAAQQTPARSAVLAALQVWTIMPKDKMDFLQAELSFFDDVTKVGASALLMCAGGPDLHLPAHALFGGGV